MNRSKVYGAEDILTLAGNAPEAYKAPTMRIMMEMMHHEAYNNAK